MTAFMGFGKTGKGTAPAFADKMGIQSSWNLREYLS